MEFCRPFLEKYIVVIKSQINEKISGPIVEFKSISPTIISAGHDGLCPFRAYPFDEIYVIATRGSCRNDDCVTIIAPYGQFITISNQ